MVSLQVNSPLLSHLEFPGRIRVLLPVGLLLQPPLPGDTVTMLTEASQSDGVCYNERSQIIIIYINAAENKVKIK